MNANRRIQSWLALPLIALALSACGKDRVYNDPATVADDDGSLTTDGRTYFPSGFFNQSVNHAGVDIFPTGPGTAPLAIRFHTEPDSSAVGAYNGTGTGNTALLGYAGLDNGIIGTKLTDLVSVNFDADITAGDQLVGVMLLVDLDCTRSVPPRVLIASAIDLDGTASASPSAGYKRYTADIGQPLWRVSGAPIADTISPANPDLVNSTSPATTTPLSLTALVTQYPNACVVNSISGADELPVNMPTAGVLFSVGKTDTTTDNTVYVNRIEIGTGATAKVFDSSDWGL